MLPVKTSKKIDKSLVLDCVKFINKIKVNTPINFGDVIVHNILDTGADVIATSSFS